MSHFCLCINLYLLKIPLFLDKRIKFHLFIFVCRMEATWKHQQRAPLHQLWHWLTDCSVINDSLVSEINNREIFFVFKSCHLYKYTGLDFLQGKMKKGQTSYLMLLHQSEHFNKNNFLLDLCMLNVALRGKTQSIWYYMYLSIKTTSKSINKYIYIYVYIVFYRPTDHQIWFSVFFVIFGIVVLFF